MAAGQQYDCVVLGGGPAGAAAATLLAQAGLRTLVVDRQRFPRYHVGETLLPAAVKLLAALGVGPSLSEAGFLPATGFMLSDSTGRATCTLDFPAQSTGFPPHGWQVERCRFDALLMARAAEAGALCRTETTARDLAFDGERVVGLALHAASGSIEQIEPRVVIDATGQQSLLASHLELRRPSPGPRQMAIWGYYRGAQRASGEHASATTLFHTRERDAWFWYTPLPGELVSIGLVAPSEYLSRRRGDPLNITSSVSTCISSGIFEEQLVNCPAITQRLVSASLAGTLHVAKDLAYGSSRAAGPGWVLVGDALCDFDPAFSVGVTFALQSAVLAAEAIIDGFARGDLSAAQLGRWQETYCTAARRHRRLAAAFSAPRCDLNQFVADRPATRAALVHLLAGGYFDPQADEVLGELERSIL